MGTNGSQKKPKTSAVEGLAMPLRLKKKKKSKEEYSEKNSNIVESGMLLQCLLFWFPFVFDDNVFRIFSCMFTITST